MIAALVCLTGIPVPVWAQVSPSLTPATAFPLSIVSPDNALGLALNPSALGALESWSLTYSHVAAARETSQRDRFDGLFFATPLGDALALGGGLELVRARDGSGADHDGGYLGAALSAGPVWSLGSSCHGRNPCAGGDGIHTADVALTVRP